jgi:hypothetical protein
MLVPALGEKRKPPAKAILSWRGGALPVKDARRGTRKTRKENQSC